MREHDPHQSQGVADAQCVRVKYVPRSWAEVPSPSEKPCPPIRQTGYPGDLADDAWPCPLSGPSLRAADGAAPSDRLREVASFPGQRLSDRPSVAWPGDSGAA